MSFENIDCLRKALEEIKCECERHSYCANCPLRDDDAYCGIRSDDPKNWNIITDVKLFK